MQAERKIFDLSDLMKIKDVESKIKDQSKKDIVYQLNEYVEMIIEWGNTHNIISSKYTKKEVIENIYDCVEGASLFDVENEVYDVGSGGGFPGVPMAIFYPESMFYLVESDRKKTSFLRTVKSALNLKNVLIKNCRIETLNELPFMVSKASFSPKNIGYLVKSLQSGGKLALWATPQTEEDYLKEAKKNQANLLSVKPYIISEEKNRVIMIFQKS